MTSARVSVDFGIGKLAGTSNDTCAKLALVASEAAIKMAAVLGNFMTCSFRGLVGSQT